MSNTRQDLTHGTGKPDDRTMKRVRQTMAILIATTLLLAAFQSGGLVSWTYDLPPSPLAEEIISAAQSWHQLMQEIGATNVGEHVGDFILSLQDYTF
ncbi:hypothetical protein [Cohaesibacter sp. ES.047]|uniref:hypothetical protein n=1 Tax=Cohaesibacter sp. ES.047 TaxID=1798205 RepID=UPI0012FE0009|nr:hypothetical protein [Cohaesibacter sp. ES.047]